MRDFTVGELLSLLGWILLLILLDVEESAQVPDRVVRLPFGDFSAQLSFARTVDAFRID